VEPERADPWDGDTPWLRRRGPQTALALLAAASFLGLTLLSTCSTRTTPPITTTTTRPMTQAAGQASGTAPGGD
jgi:hypothetical protein